MASPLKFENSFWDNPGTGHAPRYERGPQCLYEKLEQGSTECDELLGFFRERAAIEEAYANSLRQLAERKLQAEGFGRDEGATLKTAFRGLLTECVAQSEAHSDLAIELKSSVVVPLRTFSTEHRARVRASWKLIDDVVRRAAAELAQADRNHRVYTQKASVAEQLRLCEDPNGPQPGASPTEFEVKSRPSMADPPVSVSPVSMRSVEDEADADVALQRQLLSAGSSSSAVLPQVHGELDVASIVLGNVALTRHEFHVMLQRMQTEVAQNDVRFGILGTFRGLISGESLAGWWCTNYPTVVRNEADAVAVGQSMLGQGYLRFMGRGSQFQSRPNAYYQWKRPALEFQSDDENDDDDDDDVPLGDRKAHLGKTVTYERARREADEASQIYRDSVVRAEVVRTDLEEQLTNYLDTMEVWELNRLMNIKSTLGEYARISKRPVQAELDSSERLEVYEESIKPQQDIQWSIENYGTGRFTPRPILFRPFGLSPAEFQIFGVPLDEQLLVSHKEIPLFPAKALSLIRKSAQDMAPEDRYQIWTARVLLRNIHELRNMLNRSARVTLKQLRMFDLPVVANVLVLYLLELPQPLCPEELHGPLRALYSTRGEKADGEIFVAVKTLLEGISYTHIRTLQLLFSTLRSLIQGEEGPARDEFVRVVSRRLGPVIMRGKEIVGISISRIPESFAADLLEHHDEILAGIEKERPIKPVPPPSKVEEEGEDRRADELAAGLASTHILDSSAAAAAAAVQASTGQPSSSGTKPAPAQTDNEPASSDGGAAKALPEATEASSAPNGATSGKADGGEGAPTSFDEDERLVDGILEDTNEPGTTAESNMDFFLKDEDSDDSDDEEVPANAESKGKVAGKAHAA
ncbi:Rho-GTPase-activating protein 8 [Coemansia sp. RSA 552]|nr:Rho-GTPase-activating protein 8 [Coemansia sp. RSA 552]